MKNNFWGHNYFSGNRVSDDKNKYNLFLGNEVPNTALKFFSQKPLYWLNKKQKTCFGGTFSPMSVVLLDRLFPKKKIK